MDGVILSGQTSINQAVMTGDHENASRTIASRLRIDGFKANCLPQNKLDAIGEYQAKGSAVRMIVDGVYDAPALKIHDADFSCDCSDNHRQAESCGRRAHL